MTDLQRFEQNGLELIINIDNGEVFASQNAIARMCNVNKGTISKWAGVSDISPIKAEIPTNSGVQGVNLYPEDIIYQALAKYNPQLLTQCAKAGLRIYLHGLAGFKYEPKEVKPKSALELAREQVALLEEMERLKLVTEQLEQENNQLTEVVDELFDYSSIIRVAKYNNCSELNFNWRILKGYSQQMGEEIKKAPCPRFGEKNLYSHNVWRVAYPNYDLPETTTLRIEPNTDKNLD